MRHLPRVLAHLALSSSLAWATAGTAMAQGAKAAKPADAAKPAAKKAKVADTTPKAPKLPDAPLFHDVAVLDVTFTTNLKALKRDKGEQAPWHAATLSYADSSAPQGRRVVPVRARTRGLWRLKNCEFPPVRLNFANKDIKGSVWHDLDEPKLVSYCKRGASYEQYVLQEFQLYRIYRLLTPVSHQVRLLRMTYADSATGKVDETKFAFLIEDPAHVAVRAGGKILKEQGAGPDDLEPKAATLAYLFQYLIGNTDFSFSALHNSELVALPTGTNLPIAYDFDYAGAVNATYSAPDPTLPINTVRQRLYRGFCQQNVHVPEVLPLFQQKKAEIYALYTDSIGALMSPKVVKETLSYFDEFYSTIADPKQVDRRIVRECRDNK